MSTFFGALPSVMELNYPLFVYKHSDDAVPHLHARNASASSSSSSGSSSNGISTPPPASPLLPATHKGEHDFDDLDFHGGISPHWPELGSLRLPPAPPPSPAKTTPTASAARKQLPVAKPKPKSLVVASSQTLPLPLQPTVPKAPSKRTKAAAAPAPPTREAEEESRGRSRWPRLLWASTVDDESLEVLRSYHERAVGGPLPILDRGAGSRGVRDWSTKLEKAGL